MKVETKVIRIIGDQRGIVIPIESQKDFPFEIKRVYFLDQLSSDEPRGFHAHRELEQMMYVLRGGCELVMDDGKNRSTTVITRETMGVLIPRMVWHELHAFQSGTLIAVFANNHYEESDYIRDYESFKILSHG